MRFNLWPTRQNKYGAKKTEVDGFRFDSKKEAEFYLTLKALRQAGKCTLFLRQVPFHLPGGVTYRLDFLVFWSHGEIEFIDVKGFKTREYLNKKKQVEAEFGISITEA